MIKIDEIYSFIDIEFEEKLNSIYTYHNKNHTLKHVWKAVHRLADAYRLCANEKEVLFIAALFHDYGYIFQKENHEELSCVYLEKYLLKYNYPIDKLKKIKKTIMATKVKTVTDCKITQSSSGTLLEDILCDADLDSFGRQDFFERSMALYNENQYFGSKYNLEEWWKFQFDLLEKHHFLTNENENYRKKQRNINIVKLKAMTT